LGGVESWFLHKGSALGVEAVLCRGAALKHLDLTSALDQQPTQCAGRSAVGPGSSCVSLPHMRTGGSLLSLPFPFFACPGTALLCCVMSCCQMSPAAVKEPECLLQPYHPPTSPATAATKHKAATTVTTACDRMSTTAHIPAATTTPPSCIPAVPLQQPQLTCHLPNVLVLSLGPEWESPSPPATDQQRVSVAGRLGSS
jgi:hypothetical protein